MGRFRANAFSRDGSYILTFYSDVIAYRRAGLPAVVILAKLRQGFVLVTGPTGTGKSTTLAAIIREINETREEHIVTIEDPIEFVHQNKKLCKSA